MDAMVCFNRACGCCCVVINRSQDIREQFVEKVSNISSIAMTSPTSVLLRLSMRISTPLPVFFPDTEATFALIGSFFSLHARDEYGGSFEVNPRLWRTSCWPPRSTATHGCTMQSRCSFASSVRAGTTRPATRHLSGRPRCDISSLSVKETTPLCHSVAYADSFGFVMQNDAVATVSRRQCLHRWTV